MSFLFYSQRDPRWAALHLGSSMFTVGRFGCTTCSTTMGLTAMGYSTLPPSLATQKDAYTAAGLIIWDKLALPGRFKPTRYYGRNDAAILAALKDPKKFVILNVNDGAHWVLALSKTWFRNDYNVADPWFGDRRTACGTYHNIVGFTVFTRP